MLVTLAMLALATAAVADVRTQPVMPLGTVGPSLGAAELRTQIEGSDVVVTMTAPSVSARLRRARRLPRLRVTATLRDHRGRTLSASSRTIRLVR